MDPESVRALMAPVYAAMRIEVEARGGYISKFVGDGVMAVFGIPEVREDDALRAVDAAVGCGAGAGPSTGRPPTDVRVQSRYRA